MSGVMLRFVAATCVLIGFAPTVGAAEIVAASVDRADDRYHVDFVVMIDGDVDRLRAIITDYARLDELSPTVVNSRLLSGRGGEDARIELILRPCAMVVFCKTITKVSDSHVEPQAARVQYVTVPDLSDFHEGRETITMIQTAVDGTPRVRFSYAAELKPAFYIPPVIGTWLIRRAIINDLETTSRRVEQILQRDRQ